MIFIFFEF